MNGYTITDLGEGGSPAVPEENEGSHGHHESEREDEVSFESDQIKSDRESHGGNDSGPSPQQRGPIIRNGHKRGRKRGRRRGASAMRSTYMNPTRPDTNMSREDRKLQAVLRLIEKKEQEENQAKEKPPKHSEKEHSELSSLMEGSIIETSNLIKRTTASLPDVFYRNPTNEA